MKRNLRDKFLRGKSVYVCRICGKKTRDTGRGEVENTCWNCTAEGMVDNMHSDDAHPGNVEDCPECQAELKSLLE